MGCFSTWLSIPDPWKVLIIYCLFNIIIISEYMTSNADKKNTEF